MQDYTNVYDEYEISKKLCTSDNISHLFIQNENNICNKY